MIRGNTIKYSSFKKKTKKQEEEKLEQDSKRLEEEINCNFLSMSEESLNDLENKKEKLNEIQRAKIEGIMLRSRSRYENLGEKSTQYFFNVEKRNYVSKVINKLVNEEGEEFRATSDILNVKQTSIKIYQEVNLEDRPSIHSILGENDCKLSDNESQELEGEISYAELGYALKI